MAQQNGNRPRSAAAQGESRRAARGLGTLETQLMDILWVSSEHLSVQGVVDKLGPGHNYKTVMTVLNRLVEKELLERKLDGRAYRYHPHQSREGFLRSVADELVSGYLEAYGNPAGAHLTSAVDTAMPRPAAQTSAPSPAAPAYVEEERRPSIAAIIGIAALLQLITLLLRRKR